jgi:hypothetical protein
MALLNWRNYTLNTEENAQKMYSSRGNMQFSLRVCSSANYFKKYMAAGKSPFSVELHDEINDINMPKTMKMLFCCICMTYDCNQHTLDDSLKEVTLLLFLEAIPISFT